VINNVAIISGGSPDYLIDIVADGMVRFLGHENLYIRHFWLSPGAREDRRFRHFYGLTRSHKNRMSFSECEALIASVRVPIEYIKRYKQTTSGIVAILDGEDSGELKNKYLKLADAYFKREYFLSGKYPVKVFNVPRPRRFFPCYYSAALGAKRYPDKVFDLPFGVVPVSYRSSDEDVEKTGNVFFAGGRGLGAPARAIRGQLEEMIVGNGTYMPNVLNMEDYVRELRRHWICIAPRGTGWDTYRYWEIPYFGSVLLGQKSQLKIEDDFVHGESCLKFSTAGEAKSLIEEFLQKKDKLSYIANKGKELVMRKHLSTHRAMKVWKIINSFTN